MLESFTDAEIAYRREQLQRSGRAGRSLGSSSLLQRFRDARRSRRNPVRGASRYESDGPLTRRIETQWINAATHH